MNWVGGVRSRLKLQHEKKQQKEFFEKRKYISKVRRAQPYSSPTRKGVSLDLQFIQTVQRTHGPQNQVPSSAVKKPVVVDLDGHASIPRPQRRQENLELPNMSPVKTVSVLQLASATDRINANGSNCAHKESDKKKVYREWDPGDHYDMKENKPPHSGSLISSHGPVVYRTPHSTESLGTKQMNRNGHIFDSAPKSHRQLHSLSDVESETPYLYLNRGSQVGLCTIQEENAPSKPVCPKSLGMGSLEEDRNIARLGKRALYTVSEDFQMTPLKRYHEPTKKHKDHSQCHETMFGTERALFDQWDGSKGSSHWNWKKTQVGDDEDYYGCDEDSKKTRSRNLKGVGDGHEWDRFEVNENLQKKHSDHTKKMAREHLGDGDHPFLFRSDYQRDKRRKHKVNELDQRQDFYQNDKVKPDTTDKRASRENRQHRHDEHCKRRRSNSEDNVREDRKRRNDGRNFSNERTDSFVSEQKIPTLLTSTPVPDYRMDLNPLEDLMDDTAFNKKHPRTLHEEDIGEDEEDKGHNRDLGRQRGVNPPTADSNILEMESRVEDTSAMPIYKERLFSLLGMSKPATEENASPRLHGHRVDNVQHSSVERTEQKLLGSTDLNKQVRTSTKRNELDRRKDVCRLEKHSDKTKDSDQCTSKELDKSFGSNSSITVVSEDQGQVVPPSVLGYNAAKKTDESVEIVCSWNSSNPSQGNKTKKSKKGKQSSAQDALDELLQLDDMCKDAEMDEDLNFEEELNRETKFTKESQVLETTIDDRVLTFMTAVPATDKAKSDSLHHDESFVKTIPAVSEKDDVPQNDLNDVVSNTSSQISSQLTFEAMQLEYYSNLMKITPVKRKCAPSGSDRSAPTSEKVKQEPTEDSALHQKFDQLNVFQDSFNKDVTPRRGCDKIESCSKVVKSASPVLIIPPESTVKETVLEAVQVTLASSECDVSTVKDNFQRVDLSPVVSRHPESIMSVTITERVFDKPTKSKEQHIVKDQLSPSGTDLSQIGPSMVNISNKLVTCHNDDETEANIQLKKLIKIAKVNDNDQMQKDLNGYQLDCPCQLHKLETTASHLKRFSDVGITCDILSEYDKVSPAMKDVGVSCNLLVVPESEKCTNTEPCVSGVSTQTEAFSICDRSSNTEAVEQGQGQDNCNRECSDEGTLETREDVGNYSETPIATCTSQPSQSKVELSVVTPSMSSDIGTKCPDDEAVGASNKPERVADVVIDVGREVTEEPTKCHDEPFLHCSENEVAVEHPPEVGCCESHRQHLLGSVDDHSTFVKEEAKDMSMLTKESDPEGDNNSTAVFEIPESDFQETVIPESPVFDGDASPVFGRLDVALIPVFRGDEELLLSPVFRKGGGELLFSPVYIKKETSCRPVFVKEESSSPYSMATSSVVFENEKENEEKTRSSDDSAVTRKTQTNGNSLESVVVRVKNIPEMVVQETKGCGDVSGEFKSNAAEAKVMADTKTEISPGAPFQQPSNKSAIGILEQNIRHFKEHADENRQIDEQVEVERDSAVSMVDYENLVAEEDAGRAERHSRMKQKTCSALNDKRSVDVLYAGSSSEEVTTPRSKLRLKRFSIVAEEGQKMGQKPSVSPKGAKVIKKSSQQITKRLGRSKSFKLYSEGGIFGEDLPEVSDVPKTAEPGVMCLKWSLKQNDELKEIRKEIEKIRAKNTDSIGQIEKRDSFAAVASNEVNSDVKVGLDDTQNGRCFTLRNEERRGRDEGISCSDDEDREGGSRVEDRCTSRSCSVREGGTRVEYRSSFGKDESRVEDRSCRVGADGCGVERSCSIGEDGCRIEDRSCTFGVDLGRGEERRCSVAEGGCRDEERCCRVVCEDGSRSVGLVQNRSTDVEKSDCDVTKTKSGPAPATIGSNYDGTEDNNAELTVSE